MKVIVDFARSPERHLTGRGRPSGAAGRRYLNAVMGVLAGLEWAIIPPFGRVNLVSASEHLDNQYRATDRKEPSDAVRCI